MKGQSKIPMPTSSNRMDGMSTRKYTPSLPTMPILPPRRPQASVVPQRAQQSPPESVARPAVDQADAHSQGSWETCDEGPSSPDCSPIHSPVEEAASGQSDVDPIAIDSVEEEPSELDESWHGTRTEKCCPEIILKRLLTWTHFQISLPRETHLQISLLKTVHLRLKQRKMKKTEKSP
ncbi:Hypothetical predicted protein [Lecanosticta acicola]|uniref:Uncharacterized protein n=1 Tax=Lecanosticta acicola TaxID=111012 RepID=A0AAI8Z7E4_9PEZI|nr:Hypothetical predicted protein [Lecanosticta acicola]